MYLFYNFCVTEKTLLDFFFFYRKSFEINLKFAIKIIFPVSFLLFFYKIIHLLQYEFINKACFILLTTFYQATFLLTLTIKNFTVLFEEISKLYFKQCL